jgi:hypothetical protein
VRGATQPRRADRLRLALAIVAATTAAGAQQDVLSPPGPQTQTTVTATAVVRGRVTTAGGGGPIRGAEVRIRDAGGRDNRYALTDDQGWFEIRDLTPGQWILRAAKAGFVPQQFGQTHPFENVTPITLANGQRLAADLTLMRGGAITGQVLDEFGEPLAGIAVRAMRPRNEGGRSVLQTVGAADVTDDAGTFRLYGLVAGEYIVAAQIRAPDLLIRGALADVPTFYPGTRHAGEAQRVAVEPGQDATGVLIAAATGTGVTVSGTVTTSSGDAPQMGSVEISFASPDAPMITGPSGFFADVDGTGRFMLRNVPPGPHVIDADVASVSTGRPVREHAQATLTVGTSDIAGVTLISRPATTLTGRITAETGSVPPGPLRINARAVNGSLASEITISGTDSFTMPALRGRLSFHMPELPDGWMLRRFEIGGRDATDAPVDFATLPASVTARVILTDRAAELSGSVTLAKSPVSVVVFPENAERWSYPSRFIRATRTEAGGRFRIAGLPEADYLVATVPYLDGDEFHNPAFLDRLRKSATPVRLREGEKRTVTLAK